MSALWAKYNYHLLTKPIFTKSLTISFLSGLGDVIVQWFESRSKGKFKLDKMRTAKMCIYGAVIGAPFNHYWYKWLDGAILPGRVLPFLGNISNYKKLVLDQLLFAPFIICAFFTTMTLLDGKGPRAARDRIKTELVPTLKLNYLLWPAAQIINFTFVPPQHRVGYVGFLVMIWSCVLSWTFNRSKEKLHQK